MMKKIAVLFFALSLVGCEAGDRENKRALATLVGLGAGGAVGYFVGASGAILPQYPLVHFACLVKGRCSPH